jgi:hypothetical protein
MDATERPRGILVSSDLDAYNPATRRNAVQDWVPILTAPYTRPRYGGSIFPSMGPEDISGTNSVSDDCTSSFTINVFVNGQLLRTAQLAAVYDTSGNHLRAIFQSLTLPDSTNVPVVITIEGKRLTLRH